MSRREPKPLAEAIEQVLAASQPNTALAAIQRSWSGLVGETLAGWATPAGERNGVLTVHCVDSVTAHHLNAMQVEILEKLSESESGQSVREIRFRVGSEG